MNEKKELSLEKLREVNQIEGFYPETLKQSCLNKDGSEWEYLPVSIQKKWFLLKYPEGKIETGEFQFLTSNMIIITVYVYANRNDDKDKYIGKGQKLFTQYDLNLQLSGDTAFERAITKATSRALSDAGFDMVTDKCEKLERLDSLMDDILNPNNQNSSLQEPDGFKSFDNESFQAEPINTSAISSTSTPTETTTLSENTNTASSTPATLSVPQSDNSTAIGNINDAFNVICTFSTHNGYTLKNVYEQEKALISYFVANPTKVTPREVEACKIICLNDKELLAKLERKGINL